MKQLSKNEAIALVETVKGYAKHERELFEYDLD